MAFGFRNKYKSYPNKHRHCQKLEPGLSGFLCTCNGKFREKDCLRESYNILNEFADELFGRQIPSWREGDEEKSKTTDGGDNGELDFDIENSLAKEVESIKAEERNKHSSKRFQAVESGANGIVFIKTNISDPVKLAHCIVNSYAKGMQKSKFLLRLLPVEVTCKAYLEDITSSVEPLLEKYFGNDAKTFAIVFNHRNNDRLKREEVIEKIADLVCRRNEQHKADLKQPQLVILLEVIRSICCISVVPDYYSLKKYNLLENALKSDESGTETSTGAMNNPKEEGREGESSLCLQTGEEIRSGSA